MKKYVFSLLFLLCQCLLLHEGAAQAQTVPDNAEGRLWRLAKVWGYVKYYHPKVCAINWDSLLYANIPMIEGAASNADFNGRLLDMLQYAGQVTPAQAVPAPATDTNLNLDLAWTGDPTFSLPVRQFLDTFKSRAGRNIAIPCLLTIYPVGIIFDKDTVRLPVDYNDEAFRLTTYFHYWNTFNYFGPYRNLADRSWDSTLLDMMPAIQAAAGDSAFMFTLAKVQTKINDSHGSFSMLLSKYWGTYFPGLVVSRVEHKIVVTAVKDPGTGIEVGDILTKINGSPVDSFFEAFKDVSAVSNEGGLYRNGCQNIFRGRINTSIDLELLNAANQPYNKNVVRDMEAADWRAWWVKVPVSAWSILCNGYGYIHTGILKDADMNQMYDALKNLPGIVLDSRAYPLFRFDLLYRKFMAKPVYSANSFLPDGYSPGLFRSQADSLSFGDWNNTAPYTGNLFILVNEETQSAAECVAQYMSLFPGAKIIGSQTAGADGGVTYTRTPGNVHMVYFTGAGYYYYDWYQCQRNGLKIDEIVQPTIAGIKAGRDEVLEHVTGCTTGLTTVVSNLRDIHLYPNPASGALNISLALERKDRIYFRVTDITGRQCMFYNAGVQGVSQQVHKLDIQRLDPGIYFLQIVTGSGETKMIKFSKR